MKCLLIAGGLFSSILSLAAVRLPKIFSDNMMLQRDKPVTIWGWADKGEAVTVSFNGQKVKTKADRNGQWTVALKAMPAGGPFSMTVAGKNQLTISNILLGDIYICSGQSNMEWTVRDANNPKAEIEAGNYPGIRIFTVPKATAFRPNADLPGGTWQECNPQTVGDFSAVGYFFGRKLHKDLNVPIGLLSTSWGGTNVQAWLSWDVMGQKEAYRNTDINQLEKQKIELDEKMRKFHESLQSDQGTTEKWYEPSVGVSWKTIDLPKAWEQTEIGNADGVVWFRKEFELPASFAGKTATLNLGPIDDNDITWLNGQQVGATNSWNQDRVYTIDASLIRPGKNVIVVKVTDGGGGGGIYGKPEQLTFVSGQQTVSLAGVWQYKPAVLNTTFGISDYGPNGFPSQLYNAMIAPVIRFAIKGAIWYQGEANAGESYKYRELFPAMIQDWRTKWKDEFPFFWVQLANFMDPDVQPAESGWAELREAQSMTLGLPKTGQAVIIDIGEANDIHPRNKQDVGWRLALAAEKVVYDKDIVYSGPMYQSFKKEGNRMVIEFSNTGSGLKVTDKYGYVRGFAIAGADKKFVWAQATLEGNRVIVHHPSVKDPVAVRYAWGNNPDDANLYNNEGLPASPFRTDDWPGVTVGKNEYK